MTDEISNLRAADREVPVYQRSRLVLFLDGTWNSDDGEAPQTHMVRLRNLVTPWFKDEGGQDWYQHVYYDSGVGTGLTKLDHYLGGLFGVGLDDNVRAAYRFLSQFFESDPQDRQISEICIFGFSRGAYTARSLVGYIAASGLLRKEHCTRENEERAWAYYRTSPRERFPAEQTRLRALSYRQVRISCVGVFDTVGALGIPSDHLKKLNVWRTAFHDTKVSSIVDYGFQALAVDERRPPFQASLWQQPQHEFFRRIEQVWFPGVHSDIGGGYEDCDLAVLPLQWMIDRVCSRELVRLDAEDCETWLKRDPTTLAAAPQHDSETGSYRIFFSHPLLRIINQTLPPPDQAKTWFLNPFKPFEKPIGEMLHWSVLERFERHVGVSGRPETVRYHPYNVELVLPRLAYTYRRGWNDETAEPLKRRAEAWAQSHPDEASLELRIVKAVLQEGVTVQIELDPEALSDCRDVIEKLTMIELKLL